MMMKMSSRIFLFVAPLVVLVVVVLGLLHDVVQSFTFQNQRPSSLSLSFSTRSSGGGFRSSSFSSSTSLEASYKKVFVAGGSKGVGRIIIDKLINEGSDVVALVRNDESVDELNTLDGVTAIKGDAFDYKSIENNMDGCDAVISTLGGTTVAEDGAEKRVDYTGNANVIEAAGILGVTRLVLVTSIGCGSSKDAAPPATFEVLKDVLAAKEKAENLLLKFYTNMDWTIVRPGGLKTEPATNSAIVTENPTVIGTIHREDVANLVIKVLDSTKATRKVLSAIDPTITSALNTSEEGKKVEIEEFVMS